MTTVVLKLGKKQENKTKQNKQINTYTTRLVLVVSSIAKMTRILRYFFSDFKSKQFISNHEAFLVQN